MLAQAQEIFLEKTIEEKTRNGNVDGKSMGIVAKLASQCSFQYNALIEPVRENVNKGIFDRHWASVIHVGESYMTSFSTDYLPRLKPNTFRPKVSTLVRLSESDFFDSSIFPCYSRQSCG